MQKEKSTIRCTKQNQGKIICAIFLLGLLTFTSCSEDSPQPEPPVSGNTYTLKFKSNKVVEMKQKQTGQEVQNIPVGDSDKYFGKRIQLSRPEELQFKGDSLSIIKVNGVIERFKIKWQDNELYLHNSLSEKWEYCGKKEGNYFTFNTGFYIQKCRNDQRSLAFMGQEYSLRTFSDLADYVNENSKESVQETIWLKMEYNFE